MSLPRNAGSFLGGGDWGGPSAGVVLGSACQPGCRIEGHVKHQGGVVVSGGERRGMGLPRGPVRKAFEEPPVSARLLCGFSAQPRMQTHQPARGIPITHSTLQPEKAVPHRASNSLGTNESVREKTICICHFLSAGPAFS